MLEMWLLIVLSDSPSRVAITGLDSPAAISSRTSRSRGVSSLNAGSAGSVLLSYRARRARPGPKMASPAATETIARMISSAPAPFRT